MLHVLDPQRAYQQGLSKVGDILDLGTPAEVIRKSGANYSYNETRLGQGRENAKNFLNEHPEIADQIEALIRGLDSTDGDKNPDEKIEHSEVPAIAPS